MDIWKYLEKKFHNSPKKLYVAKQIFAHGLRISENGTLLLGKIKIPYTSLATAIGVDRRTVKETVISLLNDRKTKDFFKNLENAGPFLREVARILGYRCLIIEVFQDKPGILARIASIIEKKNINIVQVVAEDPNLVKNPKLYIIIACDKVPGEVISEILKDPNIKSLTIH